MDAIIVIGPLSDGLYHMGYQSGVSKIFYSISEFSSEPLAQAMADKMNRDRENNKVSESGDGR